MLSILSVIYTRKKTFCDFLFTFLFISFFSEKRSTLKGNNLLSMRASLFFFFFFLCVFFFFRADIFQKGSKTILTELSPLKVYRFPVH